ncbi:hypothetical protein H5410_046696, partial [Solanum commersonii]
MEIDSFEMVNIINGTFRFNLFQKVPSVGKKIIVLDKYNISIMRIRQTFQQPYLLIVIILQVFNNETQ